VAPAAAAPAEVMVQVPATSANLGPGFDALGLALGLHDELRLRVTHEPGLRVAAYGDVPTDETNLVVRSARAAFAAVGGQPTGLEVAYRARIPQARGLGSSAAAICAGVTAGLALSGIRDRELALRLAYKIETHPDNIAAAIYGGLTIAWVDRSSRPSAVRLTPSSQLRPVAFIPEVRTSTAISRRTLPATVSHADAAINAGRAALLVAALTATPNELLAATEDRLHQPYRLPGLPEGAALVAALRDAGIAAVLSGSGPTVMAICRDAAESAAAQTFARGRYAACEMNVDLDGTVCTLTDWVG
jgi:homoserine kinase